MKHEVTFVYAPPSLKEWGAGIAPSIHKIGEEHIDDFEGRTFILTAIKEVEWEYTSIRVTYEAVLK